MPEIITKTNLRIAKLADFFDDNDDIDIVHSNSKYNKNNTQNDVFISKNQQEFGNRKRIKP